MSGTKSPWEERVGRLLDPARSGTFVWSYKPADSGYYGGQPRIDWLACDILGRLWMIEVKYLISDRRSCNLTTELSAGQRAALTDVGQSYCGVPLLAIGRGSTLFWFHWRDIAWLLAPEHPGSPLLPLDSAFLHHTWTGPKHWQPPLFAQVNEHLPGLVPQAMRRVQLSLVPGSSP